MKQTHSNPCLKRILLSGFSGLLLMLLTSIQGFAQKTYSVSGVVTDNNGAPMPGVTIVVKGTTNGTATDNNGSYTLKVSDNPVLIFSFIGYKAQEVPVGGKTELNVKMVIDEQQLKDVVVIGYGTVKKKDLTGAVSVIKTDDFKTQPSTSVASAMKGMASGIKVTSSGEVGTSANILIRGVGNLTNNTPLYIVDGIPTTADIYNLNLQDVESIQILKDASSAAIYGSRAANGVIIITTKTGQSGKLHVDVTANTSLNWLPRYDLMDASEYKKYDDMAYQNSIARGLATHTQNHYDGNTDWQDEVLRRGFTQDYNAAFSGGSNTGNYYVSLNKFNDYGTVYGTNFDKYSFRVNTGGKKGIFSYGENLSYSFTTKDGMYDNPFANLISMPPTISVYDATHPGGFGYGDPDRANTYALNPIAQQELNKSINKGSTLNGSIYGQIDLFNCLNAKLNLGYVHYNGNTSTLRKTGNWTMGQGTDSPYIQKAWDDNKKIVVENTYNYKKKIGKNDIDVLGGLTYEHYFEDYAWVQKLNPLVVNNHYYESLASATGTTTGGGTLSEYALISYLGRVNYSYDDKYLFSATIRRDGTSRLPGGSRWGNFPSVSAAWRISREDFFNMPFINDLKLRANYGILGNANIGYWDYLATMNTAPGAIFGSPESVSYGTIQSKLVNGELGWEKKVQSNFGFDASFLNSRLTLTADYFISEGKDLLVSIPLLNTTGNNGGNPYVNAASIRNKGIEIDLGWKDQRGDFKYSANVFFTKINNKLLDLGYGQTVYYTSLTKSEIGKPLSSFYLYKMIGIFQSQDEIDNYKNADGKVIQPNAKPGDIKYQDYDGDGNISSKDRQIVGDPWPSFELGINLSASWHNFDMFIHGNGRFGYDVWNGAKATAGDFGSNQNNFKGISPWSATNPSNSQPALVWGLSANSRADQDRWLENGSYFRINEIGFGYTLPEEICKKISFESLRLGLSFNNMITFTRYSGLDPEFLDSGIFSMGVDYCSYPNPRSVAFSLSFGF